MHLQDLLDALTRLGVDVLAMLLLVGWLYRRRLAAPEMTLVFTALNIGLFAAIASIGTGHFPTGVGFGLFGLLSLVRLRSTAFTLKDVAYTFIALVLALVNGLPGRPILLVIGLNVVLLVALWLVDETRTRSPQTRAVRMTLDHAVGSAAAATPRVVEILDVEPLDIVIEEVDLVRETTRVAVRFAAPQGSWRPPLDEADESMEALGAR
jgi:hypothetical protein